MEVALEDQVQAQARGDQAQEVDLVQQVVILHAQGLKLQVIMV